MEIKFVSVEVSDEELEELCSHGKEHGESKKETKENLKHNLEQRIRFYLVQNGYKAFTSENLKVILLDKSGKKI